MRSTGIPEDLDWAEDGIKAWDEEVEKFETCLLNLWISKTKFRNSRTLDKPEVQDASQILLVGRSAPWWKVSVRILAMSLFATVSIFAREGYRLIDAESITAPFLVVVCVLFALVITILLETVLRK